MGACVVFTLKIAIHSSVAVLDKNMDRDVRRKMKGS
jgi:hypothetical protein